MAGIRRLLHRRRHRRRRLRRGCACSQGFRLCCHQAPAAQPLGCCMRLGMPRGIVHAGRLRAATVAPRRLAVARNRSQHARRPTSQASHFARIAGNGRTTAGSNAPGGVDGVHGRGPPRHEDFLRHLGYLCFAGLCALPSRRVSPTPTAAPDSHTEGTPTRCSLQKRQDEFVEGSSLWAL